MDTLIDGSWEDGSTWANAGATNPIRSTQHRTVERWIPAFFLLTCTQATLAQLPPPPVPPQNPITEQKRVLGKILFWDEQLSSDNTVACGTCHMPFSASADSRFGVHPGLDASFGTPDDVFGSRGIMRQDENGDPIVDPLFGTDVQTTSRSAQIVYGSLWSPDLFWDGRATSTFTDPETGLVSIPAGGGLESQAVRPILSDVEMAHEGRTWEDVRFKLENSAPLAEATYLPPDMAAAVSANPTYQALFSAAFGDPSISAERIAFSIATYERTLVADQTPFDLQQLTPGQQQGLDAFLSPGSRCGICHSPPFFTDQTFRNIGLRPIAEDNGRQGVTGNPPDAGRFKVPSLRNVGLRSSFMHNGRLNSIDQVLDFYLGINGQVQFPQNQDQLVPGILIPPQVRPALIDFLVNGLTDPRVASESFPFDRPILASERGDGDRDDDVDLDDFDDFAECATPIDGPVAPGCERLDMDGDGTMTCADWQLFTDAWTSGAPVPGFAECAAAFLDLSAEVTGPESFLISLGGIPDQPFALRVQGDSGNVHVACVDLYVQDDGTLDSAPVLHTLAEWGDSVEVSDSALIPGATFTISSEGFDADDTVIATDRWGDVNGSGATNIEDAFLAILHFQANTYAPPADIDPCGGNGIVNIADVFRIILAWQATTDYVTECGAPCP